MTKPDVDPLCMCGKAAPCPDHGRFAATAPRPHQLGPTFPDHLTVGERQLMRRAERQPVIDERTQWLLAKELAGVEAIDLDEDLEETA